MKIFGGFGRLQAVEGTITNMNYEVSCGLTKQVRIEMTNLGTMRNIFQLVSIVLYIYIDLLYIEVVPNIIQPYVSEYRCKFHSFYLCYKNLEYILPIHEVFYKFKVCIAAVFF